MCIRDSFGCAAERSKPPSHLAVAGMPNAVERSAAPALALLGAVATIVALYYYLVLSSRMYVDAPEKETPVAVPMPLLLAILVCAVGTVVMGMYPEPWVQAVMAAFPGTKITEIRTPEAMAASAAAAALPEVDDEWDPFEDA